MNDIFHKIQQIKIYTVKLVDDLLAGAYKSAFRGQGMEFEEVRDYTPGDDIRAIDWNVTARYGRPFVKSFREERELTLFLMVDVSRSLAFGSSSCTKQERMAEIGAALAFSAIRNQDKVGLILFTDQIELYIPPKKGTRHVLRVIRELLAFTCKGTKTDLKVPLEFLGSIQQRSAICFILSDFLCPFDFDKPFIINGKRHDLILMHVEDSREVSFPSIPWIQLYDLETGESRLVEGKRCDALLRKRQEERRVKLSTLAGKTNAGLVTFTTDQPYATTLRRYFKERKMRGR